MQNLTLVKDCSNDITASLISQLVRTATVEARHSLPVPASVFLDSRTDSDRHHHPAILKTATTNHRIKDIPIDILPLRVKMLTADPPSMEIQDRPDRNSTATHRQGYQRRRTAAIPHTNHKHTNRSNHLNNSTTNHKDLPEQLATTHLEGLW